MVNNYGYWADIIKAVKHNRPFPIYRINEIGGRMSSKTFSTIDGIILSSLANVCRTDAFRHFKGSDKQELFDQFQEQIDYWKLTEVVEVHKSNSTFTFPNGSVIQIRGLHSPTQKGEVKLTGKATSQKFKYHFALAEERYEISDSDWADVLQAIRGSNQFMEVHLANPWILSNDYVSYVNENVPFNLEKLKKDGEQFKIFDKEMKLEGGEVFRYKEIFHITNYQINNFLSTIDKAKLQIAAKHDPHRANTILYGFYGTPKGSIWKWVLPKMIQKSNIKPVVYVGGVDYGERNDPTAAYLIGFTPNNSEVQISNEYYAYGNKVGRDTNKLAEEVVEHFLDLIERKNIDFHQATFEVFVDGSAIPFITALNSYAEDMGYSDTIHFYQQTDKKKVADRIETLKTLASFGIIKVDESTCPNLMREFSEQIYNDKVGKTSNDYVVGDDHGTDAIYYGIVTRWVQLLENMDYLIEQEADQYGTKNKKNKKETKQSRPLYT